MNITKQYLIQNDCYKVGRKITPQGCMVHSTATPGVMAEDFALRWNKPGIEKAVHFFVDDADIIETLPCEKGNAWRAWHCGRGAKGSGNDTMVSLEICEPLNLRDGAYFRKAYDKAAELAAYLSGIFGFGAEDIICHSEGYAAGIASNHADVMHWFPLHGKTMDDFRRDVKARLESEGTGGEGETGGGETGEGGADGTSGDSADLLYRVQTGAFRNKDYAAGLREKLRMDGYADAYVKAADGYYKVQVGAFHSLANADRLSAELEEKGYETYIVNGNA